MKTILATKRSSAKTSAERTRLFRQRKKEDPEYDSDRERRKNVERIRALRAAKKGVREICGRTCNDSNCVLHPDRDRKRKYRAATTATSKGTSSQQEEVIRKR